MRGKYGHGGIGEGRTWEEGKVEGRVRYKRRCGVR